MSRPVYVLAGQSNARAMRDDIYAALEARHGAGGYTVVEVSAPGAPLTYKRGGADWAAGDELRLELVEATVAALLADPEARVAGMIWLQGEGDSYQVARAVEYGARLDALFDEWRSGVDARFGAYDTGVTSARVALVGLSDHATAGTDRPHWDDIAAQQRLLAEAEPLVGLVSPDQVAALAGVATGAMFRDGLHYAEALRPDLANAVIEALGQTSGAARRPEDELVPGTEGGDRMAAGTGNDTYLVNHRGDRVREMEGEGLDTVIASRSFCLRFHSQHIETLILTGEGDFDGTGNGQDNVITGNDGGNVLKGAWGDDQLFGGAGDDTFIDDVGANLMVGGAGNDTYVIDHSGNRLIEQEGEGYDRVLTSVDFTLRFHSQFLEQLRLTGRADVNGTGNGQNNSIYGNRGNNRLDGAWGDDLLVGRGGDDVLIGHQGNDRLIGGGGEDLFVFRPGHGVDIICDFSPGEDRLEIAGFNPDDVTLRREGGDTLILLGIDEEIRLLDLRPETLIPGDILFG